MDIKRLLLSVWLVGLIPVVSWASEPQVEATKPVPCAVLKEFEGEVQIFDSSRNQLVETDLNAAVPCGAWITVRSGWALVHHRQGYVVKLASQTFVQVFDREPKMFTGEDQLVLYRGQVFTRVAQGGEPLVVVTPNARTRIVSGVAVTLYHPDEEETQLLALENSATLMNRFEPEALQVVKAGELTELNFKRLRITPSTPRAVTAASLKATLQDLPLDKTEKKLALAAVQNRSARKLATNLKEIKVKEEVSDAHERLPASAPDPHSTPSPDQKKDWKIAKLGGGIPGAMDLMYPKVQAGGGKFSEKYRIQAVDQDVLKGQLKLEAAEKARLLEELGKIRE